MAVHARTSPGRPLQCRSDQRGRRRHHDPGPACLRCAAVLLTFFFTSSRMTTFKEHLKAGSEEFKKGGQRDWRQVRVSGCTGVGCRCGVMYPLQVQDVTCLSPSEWGKCSRCRCRY